MKNESDFKQGELTGSGQTDAEGKVSFSHTLRNDQTREGTENLETEGGYAKEASDDFKKKQEELIAETLKKIDIVICTALIPGKKAPKIINEKMIENMQSGSVIYDLAASQGGNAAFTKVDKIVEKIEEKKDSDSPQIPDSEK